jgi:hypothetical protein
MRKLAALARVREGINIKTFKPLYYLEARMSPRRPWLKVASEGKWWTTISAGVARRECASLDGRLRWKLR